VATGGRSFPGRLVEELVKFGAFGTVEIQQELFARKVHHVDA
jgi:hypothetical protein